MPSSAEATIIVFNIVLYFLPSLISYIRDHHNKFAIFMLNFLFGWTIIGWAIAIIWAFTKPNSTST
jgi:hypothetical protein